MKKRWTVLAMAAVLVAALTGCSCDHQWQEATCLEPKTCAECQETEGEALGHQWQDADCEAAKTCSLCGETEGTALGHDWQEATCSVPETCSRCAKEQGEPMPHTFGSWVIGETEMTKTCEVCGYAETGEIDRELYTKQELAGKWDIFALSYNGQLISAANLSLAETPEYHMYGDENGNLRFYNMTEKKYIPGSLKFLEYAKQDSGEYYYAQMVFEDGSALGITLMQLEGGQYLGLYFTKTDYIVLQKNKELISFLEGQWACTAEGEVYQISIRPDGSFDGNLDGEISGTWHLRPMRNSYGAKYQDLNLFYQKDGADKSLSLNISLGYDDVDYLEPMYRGNLRISGNLPNGSRANLSMNKLDGLTVEDLKTALEDAPKVILGTWTSMNVSFFGNDGGEQVETANTDYVLTVREDGTYTLQMEETVTGTWEVRKVAAQYGSITTDYDLACSLDQYGSAYGYLYDSTTLTLSLNTEEGSYSIRFLQLSGEDGEQMEKAKSYPIGSWTSTTLYSYEFATEKTEEQTWTDYRMTFREDGTFTGYLGREVSGTWQYYNFQKQYNQHEFRLTLAQGEETLSMYSGEGGWIGISLHRETGSDTVHFLKD